MKKILVFCVGGHAAQEALQIDEAIEQYNKGNDVTFLHCDDTIGGCNDNRCFSSIKCSICKSFQSRNRKKYLPSGIKQVSIKDYVTKDIKKQANKKFKYNDVETLRNVKFHGVDIGLGAISSYITYTRNLNPKIDNRTRSYFDQLLYTEALMTLVIEKLHEENCFDEIILHNGRFAIFKPFLNFAQNHNIDYICTESVIDKNGNISKNYFFNEIPHNINPYIKKFQQAWDEAKENNIDCLTIGKSFFERRRNAQGTGDKIYTASQDSNSFVQYWDDTKENIVIYNSSEDEFCAVSGDFEKGKVFSTQIEGIKAIVEHYKEDKSKHFYLRVHPNLMHIKYAYHQDLYKLNFPNLTVIPADSPISSYTLLDKADKIITFGSTMGIEATYAKKPSICIGPALYGSLDITYNPKTQNEIWTLIDTPNLQNKYSDKVLIYGYFFMAIYDSIIKDYLRNIDSRLLKYKIFGKNRIVYAYNKLFGSNYIYLLVRLIINNIQRKKIPATEAGTQKKVDQEALRNEQKY